MKVKFEENYRSIYTLEDMDAAKVVMKYEKDDSETPAGWLEYAMNEYGVEGLPEIIKAEAHTARNRRAWNRYGDDENSSKDMDVWISGVVETYNKFIKIGAYLSDIWETGATPYKEHIFAVEYCRK
jgi:hypothetical protein